MTICLFLSVTLTQGCSFLNTPNAQQSQTLVFNGLMIAQNTATIYTKYNSVVAIIQNQVPKMSQEDKATLVSIKTNFDAIYNEYKNLTNGAVNIQSIAITYTTFYNTFTQLKTDYNNVLKVINSNSTLFSASDMQTIMMFRNACESLNAQITQIENQIKSNTNAAAVTADITQILQDTLVIANTIATVATIVK